jgi:hypothetical protein
MVSFEKRTGGTKVNWVEEDDIGSTLLGPRIGAKKQEARTKLPKATRIQHEFGTTKPFRCRWRYNRFKTGASLLGQHDGLQGATEWEAPEKIGLKFSSITSIACWMPSFWLRQR